MDNILPPNATALQKDVDAAIALRLGRLSVPNRWLYHPEECPEHILPWLAWAVSVDVWNENWAVEIRRSVIRASVEIHRKKGTIGALKTALAAFRFDNIKVEEWFEYGASPFTFRVVIEVLTTDFDIFELSEVYTVIQKTKNVRSRLEALEAHLTTRTSMPFIAATTQMGEIVTIYPRED